MIYMMHEEFAPNLAQRRFPVAYDGEALFPKLSTIRWNSREEHHKHMVIRRPGEGIKVIVT